MRAIATTMIILSIGAGSAFADENSRYLTGWVDWGPTHDTRVLPSCPAGDGDYLGDALDVNGSPLDAEIRLRIESTHPDHPPVLTPNELPFDQIYLTVDRVFQGTAKECTVSRPPLAHPTYYEDGEFVFASPWFVGGSGEISVRIISLTNNNQYWGSDTAINYSPRYFIITPDYTSAGAGGVAKPDGWVNLVDVQTFTSDYYDVIYQWRSDFVFDGVVNLSDLTWFTAHYAHQAPCFGLPRTAAPQITPEVVTEMVLDRDHPMWDLVPAEDALAEEDSSIGKLKTTFQD